MLQRRLGLFQSAVINMIDMVGIGPFVTLPIVMGLLGGMYLYAWIAGAILSLVDAMVWSELGAAYPLAGGSYHFLKEAYGNKGAGKMMSFLFVWQTIIQAPLVAASAAIGFSDYFVYLLPLAIWQKKMLSACVIIFITILLYRKIDNVGKVGVLLWMGVLLLLGWIIFAGVQNGHFLEPLQQMSRGFHFNALLSFVFGQACVKTIYSYLGYYNVCHLGGEIKNPQKNIPLSMFISVIGIALLYLCMNMSVGSVIPWQQVKYWYDSNQNPFIISTFFEKLYGHKAAVAGTILILWVALASLFAVMLGYSRIPYAAAADGSFFKIFAKLHPTKNFPYISLLLLAAFALVFSVLFRMSDVINAVLAMRIMLQFIGQAVGVVLLRKRNGNKNLPFKMPLYPLPVILAIAMWLFIFYATGLAVIVSFFIVFFSGLLVYLVQAKYKKQWPFLHE